MVAYSDVRKTMFFDCVYVFMICVLIVPPTSTIINIIKCACVYMCMYVPRKYEITTKPNYTNWSLVLGYIQKFPDSVDNEINNNNKH